MKITVLERRSSFNSNGVPYSIEISEETFKKIKTGSNAGFEGQYDYQYLKDTDFTESETNIWGEWSDDTSFVEVIPESNSINGLH